MKPLFHLARRLQNRVLNFWERDWERGRESESAERIWEIEADGEDSKRWCLPVNSSRSDLSHFSFTFIVALLLILYLLNLLGVKSTKNPTYFIFADSWGFGSLELCGLSCGQTPSISNSFWTHQLDLLMDCMTERGSILCSPALVFDPTVYDFFLYIFV
jgi:hypothetical protein